MDVPSQKDLDSVMLAMLPCFDDRETEQNWKRREKAVNDLRRLTQGNGPTQYPQHFATNIKTLLDGILKTVKSLRTTLSTNGCELVQDLAKALGPLLDPAIEILLPTMIELCGHTKTLNRKNGDAAVTDIVANVTCNSRLIHHILVASQDKNVPPRVFAAGWLKTIMNRHGRLCEHGGGLDLIDKCIRSGLLDAKPEVKESMRSTYWTFAKMWPDRAESIMSTLDPKAQKTLENDASNPRNASKSKSNVGEENVFSKSTSSIPARSALKEAMLAQKRAKAAAVAKEQESQKAASEPPVRPNSAQSHHVAATPHVQRRLKPTVTEPHKAANEMAARPASAQSHVTNESHQRKRARVPIKDAHGSAVEESSHPVPEQPQTVEEIIAQRRAKAASNEGRKPGKEMPNRPISAQSHAATSEPKMTMLSSAPIRPPRPNRPAADKADNFLPIRPKSRITVKPLVAPTTADSSVRTVSKPSVAQESLEPIVQQTAPKHFVKQDSQSIVESQSVPRFAPKHDPHETGEARAVPQNGTKQENHGTIGPLTAPTLPEGARKATSRMPRKSISKESLDFLHELPSHETAGETVKDHHTSQISQETTQSHLSPPVTDSPPKQRTRQHRNPASQDSIKVLADLPITDNVAERAPRPVNKSTSNEHTILAAVSPGKENMAKARSDKRNAKEAGQNRRSVSPLSKDPEEARRFMARGIERIKSRTIDDLGYRKLQGLITFHDEIFQDEEKYDEMLLALLDALETPNDEKRKPLGRGYDSKIQILVTIRLMHEHNRKYFAAYYPRAVCALITARRNFDDRCHIVSGLEETAQDIISVCDPPDLMDAVLDVLETEESNEAGSRTIAMGLHLLSGLSARLQRLNGKLEEGQEARMARFGLRCLREKSADIRRAVIAYCVELQRMIKPEERFFHLVTDDTDELKYLLTYYIAHERT